MEKVIEIVVWFFYIALFFFLARKGKGHDVVLSGKVGFFVQSFAYVATYISAVALVGFGGLAYMYGLQMMLIALGNVLLGTCFVYLFLTWRTRELQVKLQARTPAHLLSLGHNNPYLRSLLGFVFTLFLSVYAAAVIKGAALMLQNIIPVPLSLCIWILAFCIGLAVLWGGLRGVLLTEAMQGCIMLFGIAILAYQVISQVGGVMVGVEALSKLEPTALANNGFTSLSSGSQGYFIFSLVVVTSVAVWAQPQMIQRHFSVSSKSEIMKALCLASVVLLFIVGGMYFISSLSRLILPSIEQPDQVIPTLVDALLPGIGKQIFTLAIISASLSTCTALFHIASSSLTEDILGRRATKKLWLYSVLFCIIVSGFTAQAEGKLIALIHTTSWSVIGATALVPYIMLVLWNKSHSRAALWSALGGGISCFLFYLCLTPHTSVFPSDFFTASETIKQFPPFVVGLAVSGLMYGLGVLTEKEKFIAEVQVH